MKKSKLHLYGPLADKFGKEFEFEAESLTDCIGMLQVIFNPAEVKKEFAKYSFGVVRGKTGNKDIEEQLTYNTISLKYGEDNDYHLIPIIEGADAKGWIQTILGIVLIVVGAIYDNLYMVQLGIAMAFGGVAQLLAPSPNLTDYDDNNSNINKPSYVFQGAINVTEQGATIPLCYGKFICGSIVIASELETEHIPSGEYPGEGYDGEGDGTHYAQPRR